MRAITMSIKESRQIAIFDRLKKKEMTQREAGALLRLSVRQVRRKLKRYVKSGPSGLIHRSRGRPSNRRMPEHERQKILNVYRNEFPDFGPTLASEKLFELHEICVHPETLRIMLLEAGLWVKKRKRSKHRKWRPRKEHFGELVQLDGSHHDWFEGRGNKCCLIGFIDDATGSIWCRFAKNESHESVMQATRGFCQKHGKPLAMYTDRGGVFKVNINNPDGELKTQYERALSELDVKVVHARSPQAKGRVERLFGILQDRLIKELRLRGISDMKIANDFLKQVFIPQFNRKFAKKPKSDVLFFRPVSSKELEKALCIKETRKLRNNFTIQYKNKKLQLQEKQKVVLQPKDVIQTCEYWSGKIELYSKRVRLNFKEVSGEVKPKLRIKEQNYVTAKKVWVPAKDHPWRRSWL